MDGENLAQNEEKPCSTCFQPISPLHFQNPKTVFRVIPYPSLINNNYILISAPGVFLISDLSSSKDLVLGISAVLPVPLAFLIEEFFVT